MPGRARSCFAWGSRSLAGSRNAIGDVRRRGHLRLVMRKTFFILSRLRALGTIIPRSARHENPPPLCGGMETIYCNSILAISAAIEDVMICNSTCLRHGQPSEFHQLINRKCSDAHEIFVEQGSIFGR